MESRARSRNSAAPSLDTHHTYYVYCKHSIGLMRRNFRNACGRKEQTVSNWKRFLKKYRIKPLILGRCKAKPIEKLAVKSIPFAKQNGQTEKRFVTAPTCSAWRRRDAEAVLEATGVGIATAPLLPLPRRCSPCPHHHVFRLKLLRDGSDHENVARVLYPARNISRERI